MGNAHYETCSPLLLITGPWRKARHSNILEQTTVDCADLNPHMLVAWISSSLGVRFWSAASSWGYLRTKCECILLMFTHRVERDPQIYYYFFTYFGREILLKMLLYMQSHQKTIKMEKETHKKINKHPLGHSFHLKQISVVP